LSDSLITTAAVVLGTVREEPVDDHSDNWEQEDNQAPEYLVGDVAVGLEYLDWELVSTHMYVQGTKSLTEDDDIENQHDETNDTTANAGANLIALARDRSRGDKGHERELDEHADEGLEQHRDGNLRVLVCCCGVVVVVEVSCERLGRSAAT
jgi:hypothetical protein